MKYLLKLFLLSFSILCYISSIGQRLYISGSNSHSVAVCLDGSVVAWGSNTFGQIGLENDNVTPRSATFYSIPQRVGGLGEITKIDAGSGSHTLALTCDGQIYAWGANQFGQLGNSNSPTGVSAFSAMPRLVQAGVGTDDNKDGYLDGVLEVSGGNDESFAILKDGRLVAWGQNDRGQLGDGTSINRALPVFVLSGITAHGQTINQPLNNVIHVESGDENGYAVTSDGKVWSWGESATNPSLGRNTTPTNKAMPILTSNGNPLTNIKKLDAGDRHLIMLDNNGVVWSIGGDWGPGQRGITAGYDATNYAEKVAAGQQINGGTFLGDKDPIIEIAAGQAHSVALSTSGRVYTWGANAFFNCGGACSSPAGQLGNGTTQIGASPTGAELPTLTKYSNNTIITNAIGISKGDAWTFITNTENKIFGAGWNGNGQLGLNNTISNNPRFIEIPLTSYGCSLPPPEPTIDLGNDYSICSGFTHSINVGLVYPGFKVEYIKDDIVKNTINIIWKFQGTPTPMQPYVINEYGKWAVRITDIRTSIQRSCSPYQTAYNELTISPMPQKFTVPNNLIFCSNIVTKVKVNNTDSLNNPIYAWYPNSNSSIEMGRTKSNSSLIINDNVLAGNTSKTIYVEEIHEKSGAIFDSAQVKNHISDVPNAKEYSMYMEVLEKLTLDSLSFLYKTFSSSSTTYSGKIQIYAPMTSYNSFAPDKTKILFESQSFDVISNSNTYKKYNVPMNITLEPGFYFIGISNNPQGYVGIFDQTNGFAYSGYNFSNNTPILDKNKDHSLKIWGSSNYNNTAQSGVVGIFFDIKYRTTKKFCDRIPVYINKDCNCTKPSSVSISGNTNTCSGETIELKGSSSHTNGIKQNINFVWYKKGTTAGAYAPSPITNKSIPNVQSSDTSTWILRVEDGSYGLSDCYVEASTKFNIGSKLNFDNVSTNPINLHIYEEFNMEAEISGAKIDSVIFLVDNKITTKTYSAPYKSSKYNAPINFPVYVYAYNKGCKSEFYDQFGSVMSVNNTQGTNKQISLYPNPFSTTTSINTINNMEYVIIDNQGRIVETGIGENTTVIGEKLPKGAYIVKITSNNENAVYSILKL